MPVASYKRSDRCRGFTLIELMLSIALVLLLVIGINYVFKATADAVGAGEEIGTITRDTQSAQPMIFDDFRNIAKNPPCFIIASQIVTQFLNADDAATGSDPYTIVSDNSGTTTTIGPAAGNVSPALYNYRNHRCDMVRFPAHGFYPRRSANNGSLTSPTTAEDAFITIAHAALPEISNPSVYLGPTNDKTSVTLATQRVGAYASDWALARSILLMKDLSSIAAETPNDVYYPVQGAAVPPYAANIAPLGFNSPDNNSTPANQTLVQSSRYDLAAITIEQFRRQIADSLIQWRNGGYGTANGTITNLWWNPLIYTWPASQQGFSPVVLETGNPPTGTGSIIPYSYYALGGGEPPTYNFIQPAGAPAMPAPDLTRMQCNPLIQTPLTAQAVAQMAPYFLQHCSQFIVEYAGDFIQQDNNPLSTDPNAGAMTGIGPDGQIDYVLDANGNKRIRWYGMPRSFYNGPNPNVANNPAIIRGFDPGGDPTGLKLMIGTQIAANLTDFVDVIPLRDYWYLYAAVFAGSAPGSLATPPWEVDVNFDPTRDYATTPGSNIAYTGNPFHTNAQNNARYACAWHDDMPAMIRILIKVDDPNNKIKDGPWYEYVFKLK